MPAVIEAIERSRIIGIVRLPRYDQALEIARALLEGGIQVMEFTLTGAGAYHAISTVRTALGESVQVGVGTVLEPGAVQGSLDAGAQFVVTPVTDPEVIASCKLAHLPILCGALSVEAIR
ncbi:MAG TPA: bifunctional 4-hydroxy-2-oxoglutarate aldolase/2-dehydro-3-deoxy-phosphogluconate aldolase [Ktedonobacteraceae bacterium]|nr:bifunctional 4-hydroxy-2-oxoglutarate aldolase/2-dehydro-3-deoxy-phosphogluconate aldolase [Ktedonobacteraceae bacterium]